MMQFTTQAYSGLLFKGLSTLVMRFELVHVPICAHHLHYDFNGICVPVADYPANIGQCILKPHTEVDCSNAL